MTEMLVKENITIPMMASTLRKRDDITGKIRASRMVIEIGNKVMAPIMATSVFLVLMMSRLSLSKMSCKFFIINPPCNVLMRMHISLYVS